MTIRLEFGRSSSKNFDWVIRLCRKFRGFKKVDADVWAVDCDEEDVESMKALISATWSWRKVAFYADGVLLSRMDAFRRILDLQSRRRATAPAIEDLDRKLRGMGLKVSLRWKDRRGPR